MRFDSGSRVGPFEILSALGAGGMGEVYRARDSRLDRIVALKFLSGSTLAASDPQRFQREARAISRVSHPNVCALHDIGESDGLTYLVLEYVAGDTLADRIERGPLPLQEVFRCGIQIADALDAAHRQGVVHRDLKPGNIMLTRDGVKLLDFGLAKLRSASFDAAEAARTATVSLSGEGLIVGTLPYMAPEQLEAKAVDARADIFAFGAVLYEMATGARPFKGDSRISLMAAVLTDTPEPMTLRQSLTPPSLERLVRRCLEKDPENRWQTARDLAAELRWIADPASGAGTVAPAATPRRRSWLRHWALRSPQRSSWAGWLRSGGQNRPFPCIRESPSGMGPCRPRGSRPMAATSFTAPAGRGNRTTSFSAARRRRTPDRSGCRTGACCPCHRLAISPWHSAGRT
jgi:eukaryotic-like serine/threonine-protein kinase